MLIHMVASVMASVIHLVALIMDIIVLVEFARTVNLIGSNITGEIIFLFIVVILLMGETDLIVDAILNYYFLVKNRQIYAVNFSVAL